MSNRLIEENQRLVLLIAKLEQQLADLVEKQIKDDTDLREWGVKLLESYLDSKFYLTTAGVRGCIEALKNGTWTP